MHILQNISLKPYNTFGIDAKAEKFISVSTEEGLKNVLQQTYAKEVFILGGGSNMLLTKDLTKTVIHVNLKGIALLEQHENHVLVSALAGENWHDFVLWCIAHDFGGVENLSLIPGNVGTTPIQNIGAYGVELKDVFHSCEALHVQTMEKHSFTNEACKFGYRESIFKNECKGEFVITKVVFKLSTKSAHCLHTEYGAIRQELAQMSVEHPNIKAISDAVIRIRESKLPNPKELGNSGSFFKNPIISKVQYEKLLKSHPETPSYPVDEQQVKIPAGWLIEQAGMKGYRNGDAGVHTKQALVLVNYGAATGKEIHALAQLIQEKVQRKFGISLSFEVNII